VRPRLGEPERQDAFGRHADLRKDRQLPLRMYAHWLPDAAHVKLVDALDEAPLASSTTIRKFRYVFWDQW
jgi:hypothetical protein